MKNIDGAGAGVSVPSSFNYRENKRNAAIAHAKCDTLKITSSPVPSLASNLQGALIGYLTVRTGWARAANANKPACCDV